MHSYGEKFLRATLPNPVGVNATIRTGKGRIFKSKRSQEWIRQSFKILRENGFVPQEHRVYWCSATITLYTSRLDIDAVLKNILDLIMWSLSDVDDPCDSKQTQWCKGVQDKWNGEIHVFKEFESKKEKQRIEVVYSFIPVGDKEEFTRQTRMAAGMRLS